MDVFVSCSGEQPLSYTQVPGGGTKMVNRHKVPQLKQTHRRDILLRDSQSYLILYTISFVSAYCWSTLVIINNKIHNYGLLSTDLYHKLASIKLR